MEILTLLQAKWILKKYPELEKSSGNRLDKSFDASQVSIKLLMFHVLFLSKLARPRGVPIPAVIVKSIFLAF